MYSGYQIKLLSYKYPATDYGRVKLFRVQILFGIPHEIGDRENLVPVSPAYAMLFLALTDFFV